MKKYIVISFITIALIIVAVFVVISIKEQKSWELCLKSNDIDRYIEYVNKYPKGKFINIAKSKHDSLLWIDAQSKNTYDSYQNYLSKSYFLKNKIIADSLKEEVLWLDAKNKNLIEYFENYNKLFQNGKYINLSNKIIEEFLWKQALKDNKKYLFENYINRFPNGKYTSIAREYLDDIIWDSITVNPNSTKSEIEAYINEFPNGKHKQSAKNRIEILDIIEKRKTDLSWLIGFWQATNSRDISIDIKDTKECEYGSYATRYYGTYSVDGSKINFQAKEVLKNEVVKSIFSVSGSYISGGFTKCDETAVFNIDYENLTLGIDGRIFKKEK